MKVDKKIFLKSISYRICITLVTALITGWHIALWLAIIGTAIFYVHEKIWERINV